jgi:CRP-like cAMP-binding protein
VETATVDFGILAGAGAPTHSYKAGDVIFREGDPARELCIVKSGKVEGLATACSIPCQNSASSERWR